MCFQNNPFSTTQTQESWIDTFHEGHQIVKIKEPGIKFYATKPNNKEQWRLIGYNWFDYAPTPLIGGIDDLERLIEAFRSRKLLPFRLDRILLKGNISNIPKSLHLGIKKEYRLSNTGQPTPKQINKYHQMMRTFQKRTSGSIKRVDPTPEILEIWKKQKHAWVIRNNKRFCLSKKREFELFKQITKNGRAWVAITADGKPAGVLVDPTQDQILRYYLTSYDPEFSNFSISTMLLLHAWLEAGKDGVDFMWGEEEYKNRFANNSDTLLTLWSK